MTDQDTKPKEFCYNDYPLLRIIQDNVIGHDLVLHGSFGTRKVVYCDYTASGRCLSFVEDFIRNNVLPVYANTHSVTGYTAEQSGKLRAEARRMIKLCVNAGQNDVLIFTGSGATSGFHKLAWALKINQPRVAEETVVITGPYEHHANILLWRDYGTHLIRVRDGKDGNVDIVHLEEELKFWKEKKQHLLVVMSAASNVTGIITDTELVAEIAHRHGALAIFDYAAGGPYLEIDMNLSENGYKDAIVVSPHKFVGGPGTPGILVAKKRLFKNSIPDRTGGGTVEYVSRTMHQYKSEIEEREEGGTPDIIGCIRAAISFQLKQDIGTNIIQMREEDLCRKAFLKWRENHCICVLGSSTAKRLPIFSFVTIHELSGKLIHHHFISTLLNDIFGIQSRSGCACAGPYGHDLFGLSETKSKIFLSLMTGKVLAHEKNGKTKGLRIIKPGFTRLNLPYFYDDDLIDYIIESVDLVTKYGWKLLPQYTFDCCTGVWHRKDIGHLDASMPLLKDINFHKKGLLNVPPANKTKNTPNLKEVLRQAQKIFKEAETVPKASHMSTESKQLQDALPRDKLKMRWFLTPDEASKIMASKDQPFQKIRRYKLPFKFKQETEDSNTNRQTVSNFRDSSSDRKQFNNDKYVFLPSIKGKDQHVLLKKTGRATLKKRFYSDSDVHARSATESESENGKETKH